MRLVRGWSDGIWYLIQPSDLFWHFLFLGEWDG